MSELLFYKEDGEIKSIKIPATTQNLKNYDVVKKTGPEQFIYDTDGKTKLGTIYKSGTDIFWSDSKKTYGTPDIIVSDNMVDIKGGSRRRKRSTRRKTTKRKTTRRKTTRRKTTRRKTTRRRH